MTNKTIYFDMDGTFVNLYGVENWLDDLVNKRVRPYAEAKPMFSFSIFARFLHRLQNNGYKIGIISWVAKNSNENYDSAVAETKKTYLAKHLPSVKWDEIHILKYGTPKSSVGCGYLFDDEEPNRTDWVENGGVSFGVDNIFGELKNLLMVA